MPGPIMPGPIEMLFGFLVPLVFWAAIIAVVVLLVRGRGEGSRPSGSALQILEESYARGEITREQYFERRAVLTGRAPPPPATPAPHSDASDAVPPPPPDGATSPGSTPPRGG